MATKTKVPILTPDYQFWDTEHKERQSIHLSSHQGLVPIARLRFKGEKGTVRDLAAAAARDIPEIREVQVSNRAVVLMHVNNGIISKEQSDDIRRIFLAKFRDLTGTQTRGNRSGGSGSTGRDAGNTPADQRGTRVRSHRGITGKSPRSGGGPG